MTEFEIISMGTDVLDSSDLIPGHPLHFPTVYRNSQAKYANVRHAADIAVDLILSGDSRNAVCKGWTYSEQLACFSMATQSTDPLIAAYAHDLLDAL